MPDELYLPHALGHLYRNQSTGREVTLLYKDVWMYDIRPDSENMLPAVIYMDDDYDLVTYPEHLWEEVYEPVPASIALFDECEG